MFSVPILLPILFSATPAQPPQEPGRAVFAIIPLQSVCAAPAPIALPLWATMTSRQDGLEGLDLLGIGEQEPQFDPSTIVDFLNSQNEQAVDAGDLMLDVSGDSLIALGNSDRVTELRQSIRKLSAILTRPIDVEVTFWNVGDSTPTAAVLSPKQYAQFAAAHEPLWQRNGTTRSGQPLSLESSRWNRYVRDVDVEIASKSSIMRPSTDAFFEGSNVLVLPHALSGGDEFVAHVQFARAARLGNIQRVSTGIPDAAQIDAATVASLCGGCSGRISNGGALCVSMTGHAAGGISAILTIRLSSRVPPAATKMAGMAAFPVSALTSLALVNRVSAPPPNEAGMFDSREIEVLLDEINEGYGCVSTDRLSDLVHSTIGDDEETLVRIGGGHLFVQGSETAIERAESLVRSLQEGLLRTVDVEHTIRLADGADGKPHTVLHDLRMPTLHGRHATLMRRIETNIISDLNVEVAEDSKAVDPWVTVLAFGSWLQARVVDGDESAHLVMTAQCSHCELPESRQMVPAGALSLPELASQQVTHDGNVVAGQAIRHGDGTTVDVGGRKDRSAAETTVRW